MPYVTCDEKICVTKKCKDKKACACNCNGWFQWNEALRQGCEAACQQEVKPSSKEDYLQNYIGGDVAANYYGLLVGDYNVLNDSLQGQVYQQEIKNQEKANANKTPLIIGLGIAALALIGVLIFMKK